MATPTINVLVGKCPGCDAEIFATAYLKVTTEKPQIEDGKLVKLDAEVSGARINTHDCLPKVTRDTDDTLRGTRRSGGFITDDPGPTAFNEPDSGLTPGGSCRG